MSALDLAAVIRGRRSVRRYRPDPVPRELLAELLELAAWAPSAGNRQSWQFTVVSSGQVLARMAAAVRARWEGILEANRGHGFAAEFEKYSATFSWFDRAPAAVVFSAREADGIQRQMLGDAATAAGGGATSAAMAAQTFMLAAHARGLGSCCLTAPLAAAKELGESIGLKRRQEIVCLVAVGWPAEAPPAPPRRPLEEIARFVE